MRNLLLLQKSRCFKAVFNLSLFFNTHIPLNKNLLWIAQVCLLPNNTCNNGLNLLAAFLTTGKLRMLAMMLTITQ